MEWLKVEVQTTAFGSEIITAVLMENNIIGVEIINANERVKHLTEISHTWDYAEADLLNAENDDVFVIFYVPNNETGISQISLIKIAIAHLKTEEEDLPLGTLEIKTESANDKLWLNEWKKYFKPFNLGDIVIVPEWEDYTPKNPSEVIFKIDPGTAFGTGQHETTKLCINALSQFLKKDENVLDIGCGSGILSIISLLLGASDVFACDIDPAGAITATRKNAEINNIDLNNLTIRSGDVLSEEELRAEITKNKYDVIVANIVADVIINLIPFVKNILKPSGKFIASGIIDERAEEVLNIFEENKFKILEKYELKGWVCFVGIL